MKRIPTIKGISNESELEMNGRKRYHLKKPKNYLSLCEKELSRKKQDMKYRLAIIMK
jgi:hypothetical protein